MALNNLNFPLNLTFKISTLSNDFNITDSNGNYVAYVRQKMFKLKENVIIYDNNKREREIYSIKANQWLDFNASYEIKNLAEQRTLGKISRNGMRSLWKSSYEVYNDMQNKGYTIQEDSVWKRFFDGIFGEIPIIGFFSGYVFNPSYTAKDTEGKAYFKLVKMPSFFGRRFQLIKLNDLPTEDQSLLILSFMMMVLLERTRG